MEINCKSKIYRPKFIRTKNHYLLTKNRLILALESSYINDAFQYEDPEIIADIIQTELNSIIEMIAPTKYQQFKKKYTPYYNKKTVQDRKTMNEYLTDAIKTNNQYSWRLFKNFRNSFFKGVKELAANYIKNRFMHYKDKWKCIKEYNGNSKTNPPSTLIHEGTSITSPKKCLI